MDNEMNLELFRPNLMIEEAKREIRACDSISEKYGLSLSEQEITELVECRHEALLASGRIEFAGGILPKLIYAFCDSPYIEQSNYAYILSELQEAFYYYKTDSMDRFSDDELIEFMVKVFNGRAQGSTEYLIGTSLDALCRYAREEFDPCDADQSGDLF